MESTIASRNWSNLSFCPFTKGSSFFCLWFAPRIACVVVICLPPGFRPLCTGGALARGAFFTGAFFAGGAFFATGFFAGLADERFTGAFFLADFGDAFLCFEVGINKMATFFPGAERRVI